MVKMYTSGWPKIQKKCCHKTAEPPACVLKKVPPKKRSINSMIWAADSGGSAITMSQESMSMTQTNIGILASVIPGQRMEMQVTITFSALAMLPIPATRMPRIQ